MSRSFLLLLAVWGASAHAPPTPIPVPPLHVQVNRLIDSKGTQFLLRGVVLPLLDTPVPTPLTLRTFQQRWNLNAVRLPVSVAIWKRDGQAYLDRIAAVVASANQESLVVVLTARQDGAAMPDADTLAFWRAAAQSLKDTPGLIFSLFNEPSSKGIAGDRAAVWRAWNSAMQPLVDAIRAAGAAQVIAASSFQDGLDFQGFGSAFFLRDPNVIYETHTVSRTDDDRDRNFGFLVSDAAVFAGSWNVGAAACGASSDEILGALAYFDRRNTSWTVDTGVCTVGDQTVLLFMTGDPNGFGSLDPTQIANAAGGFPGPVAPGEIIGLYGQLIGPQESLGPTLTNGRVDSTLGGVQVLFDGVPVPILLAGYFQVNVQVPYEVAGRKSTVVQLFYRQVPSSPVELAVADTAPGIFTTFTGASDALLLNQDGSLNEPANPAPRGSVVALFATGVGQMSPPAVTGVPAAGASPGLAANVTIAGKSAEILYAGPAPTLLGVAQINARIPDGLPAGRAALVLTVGSVSSRTGVVLWVQ